MNDTIQYLPVIALRGTTILPDMIVHFDVSRKKSVKALEKAMVEDQRVFLITQKAPQTEDPGQEDLYKIGTVAVIKQLVKTKSGIIQVLVEGRERGELLHLDEEGLYLEAEIAVFDPSLNQSLDENIKEAMLRGIKEIFIRYYYLYQTTGEIGDAMGIRQNTVKSKLKRGRKKLKGFLMERGMEP